MRVVAIAVVGENGVIGDGHDQPFKFKEDWERFKATTMGHPMVLGRHTHEAIGRYLSGRTTIIVSRDPEQVELSDSDSAPSFAVGSVETALELAESLDDVCFVCGGGQVYRNTWDFLTELDITEVHASAEGSVTFPRVDPDEWRLLSREPRGEFDFTRWFPITRTDRLELQPVHPDDEDDWVALHTDPALWQHAPGAMVVDRDRLRADVSARRDDWLRHGLGYWLVRDRVDGRLLGVGGVRRRDAEAGEPGWWNLYYRFAVEAQGQGYAQELARAALATLQVVDPSAELRAYVRPSNQRSAAVAQAIGLSVDEERLDEHGKPQQVYSARVAEL